MDQIILLGNTRINCSDIKNCGIITLELPYKKIYQQVPGETVSPLTYENKWTGRLMPVKITGESALDAAALQESICRKKDSYFIKKTDCLFLTTGEDRTIIFSEPSAEFDIYEKLKEIQTFMAEIKP